MTSQFQINEHTVILFEGIISFINRFNTTHTQTINHCIH